MRVLQITLIVLLLGISAAGCANPMTVAPEEEDLPIATLTSTPIMANELEVAATHAAATEAHGAKQATGTASLAEAVPRPTETATVTSTAMIETPSRPEAVSTATDTIQAIRPRAYLSVTALPRGTHLTALSWEPSGQTLHYAVFNFAVQNAPAAFCFEPSGWEWWQFDLKDQQHMLTPGPTSSIDLETRQLLGVCPEGQPDEDNCDCAILFESPYGDQVVFTPVNRGETTFLAHKDSSNIVYLEDIRGMPSNVQWSPDGQWILISVYAYRAPGMEVHYLVDTNGQNVWKLDDLTGHTLEYVNFLRPQFSPDSRYLAYAATDNADYKLESEYGIFLLDLSTLVAEALTEQFGPFQWQADSQGLYVLDNAVVFEFGQGTVVEQLRQMLAKRSAALYYVDLIADPIEEKLIADNIDYYPYDDISAWLWAYSPEAQAVSMVGLRPESELGILLLSP